MTRRRSRTHRHKSRYRSSRPGVRSRGRNEKELVLRLKIGWPRFGVLRKSTQQFYSIHKQRLLIAAVVAVLAGGSWLVYANRSDDPESLSPTDQASTHFTPLTYEDDSESETEYRFDRETNVLSFNAVYNGVTLTISQQPAPEHITSDPEELTQIARQINAGNPVESDKGVAYVTPESDGGQTALFTTDETLVFVRSHRTMSSSEWQDFINELEARL